MSDKVKRAARERMARTGEPYTLARRMVIEEHARLKAAEAEVTPENARQLVIPEGAGDWLRALLGPHDPEPAAGPPYAHVLRLPETEEEMAAEPYWPAHTVTAAEGEPDAGTTGTAAR